MKEEIKICRICKEEKPRTEFHKDRSRADGYDKRCKMCYAKITDRRVQNGYYRSEKYRQKFRKDGKTTYQNRLKNITKYHETHKIQISARQAVKMALIKGILIKVPCEVCGDVKSQAHHPSYKKEDFLKVKWLCEKHHKEEHRTIKR